MGLWKRHSDQDLGPQPLLRVSTNPNGAEDRRAGLTRGSLQHIPAHCRSTIHNNNAPKAPHTNGLHHSPNGGHSSLPYTPSLSSLHQCHQPGLSYTSHRRTPSHSSLSYTPSHNSLPFIPSKIPLSKELRLYRPNTLNNNNTNYCSLPYSPGLLGVNCLVQLCDPMAPIEQALKEPFQATTPRKQSTTPT